MKKIVRFKNFSLKELSFLGLTLMGVSALTAAMIPLKAKSGPVHQGRIPNNGHAVQSTINGRVTASVPSTVSSQVGGNRSWTLTGECGNEEDEASATSRDTYECTDTHEMGWCTADGTTTVGHENFKSENDN
ncbi:hypothetical protein AAHN97_26860 [Chitinophaga niabensis]|uniref:hypothetical protein n=1 Tax=Chitinophaga niabensis TaxID=536979 RepID=UPI0031BB5C06